MTFGPYPPALAGLLKYTPSVSANKLKTDKIHLDKDFSVTHDMTVDSVKAVTESSES